MGLRPTSGQSMGKIEFWAVSATPFNGGSFISGVSRGRHQCFLMVLFESLTMRSLVSVLIQTFGQFDRLCLANQEIML